MPQHDHLQSLPTTTQHHVAERQRSREYATAAHEGQVRKLTGEPYIVHPIAVEGIAQLATRHLAILQGAMLHDTVEDTAVTLEDLHRDFGSEVALNVWGVTKDSAITNWRQRNEAWLCRFQHEAPEGSVVIGNADKIDNLGGTIEHYHMFGPVIWERFTGTPDDYLWWYTSVHAIAKRRSPNSPLNDLLEDKLETFRKEVLGK